MSIEKRIKDHMSEQAQTIQVESASPGTIADRASGGPRRAVTGFVALLVMLAAGFGFWTMSNDDRPSTEIAAGESEEEQTDESDEADSAGDVTPGAANVVLNATDVTSDNSPGYGQVMVEDGLYYVLSTAPGRVQLPNNPSEEDYFELYRQSHFYIFDADQGWTVSEMGDRFISDFDVDDGLLYVISTGSISGAGPAIGTSADRGQSWTWNDLDELPNASQVSLLVNDEATLVAAQRWGHPPYEEVLRLVSDAGITVSDRTLYNFDHLSVSYLPTDPDRPCDVVVAPMVQELKSYNEYYLSVPEEEREELGMDNPDGEFDSMFQWIREELAATGCEGALDVDSIEDIALLEELDLPEPVTVTWEELGIAVPEEWKPWAGVFRYENQQLNEVALPFENGFHYGYGDVFDGRLSISVYIPAAEEGRDAEYGSYDGETRWSTSDGLNWNEERIDYSEEEAYDDRYNPRPEAGDSTFRIWWDEAAYEEAYVLAEAEAAATEDGIEDFYVEEPAPLLQRSIDGGEWETVSLGDIAPGIDVGGRRLNDVRGTTLGVLLVYGEPYTQEGPGASGITVVHSSNGVDWASFELDGTGIDVYGQSGDELLLFVHDWTYTDGEQQTVDTVLLTVDS